MLGIHQLSSAVSRIWELCKGGMGFLEKSVQKHTKMSVCVTFTEYLFISIGIKNSHHVIINVLRPSCQMVPDSASKSTWDIFLHLTELLNRERSLRDRDGEICFKCGHALSVYRSLLIWSPERFGSLYRQWRHFYGLNSLNSWATRKCLISY